MKWEEFIFLLSPVAKKILIITNPTAVFYKHFYTISERVLEIDFRECAKLVRLASSQV